MELFLDSCDIGMISEFSDILTGITTNPKILGSYKNETELLENIYKIKEAFPQLLINLQVIEDSVEGMIEEGLKIASLGENFIVKIPVTLNGVKAMKCLSAKGIKTNGTLCFSLLQAKLAQNAGATYISPFIGRMEDFYKEHTVACDCDECVDALDIVEEYILNLRENIFETKILAASIRNFEHLEMAIANGVDAVTISPAVFKEMFCMKLLEYGRANFKSHWPFSSFRDIIK